MLKKQVLLDQGFKHLWDRIKARTTYRVEFSTEELIDNASRAIKTMPAIKAIHIRVEAGQIKPVIDHVFPLHEVGKAQQLMEELKVQGKLVYVP